MEGSIIFPFRNSRDKQGKLRQTQSCAASLLPSPSHMSISPLGTLPTEKQHGRCSPHPFPDCRDLQGSKPQAGQVAVPNRASPAPGQALFAQGVPGKDEFIWGLAGEETNHICKRKTGNIFVPLILKAGKVFFASFGLSVIIESTSLRVVGARKHPAVELYKIKIRAWIWNHGSFCLFSYLPRRNGQVQ